MPAIEADLPPRLRSIQEEPICASRQEVVLPVDGAPLVYSTSYARKMAIRVTSAAGKTFDLPVEARADRGGYVLKNDRPIPAGLVGPVRATLHRSEEHTSELQSLMRISYAVFCLKNKKNI